MTRSKKAKLAWKRAAIAAGGYEGLERAKDQRTPRNPRPKPREHLVAAGARRLNPLAGVSPTKIRAPRLHAMCGRVHAPGKCNLTRTAYGSMADVSIVPLLEERWAEERGKVAA